MKELGPSRTGTEQDGQIGQYEKLSGGIVCNTCQLQPTHTKLKQLISGNKEPTSNLGSRMQYKTAKSLEV